MTWKTLRDLHQSVAKRNILDLFGDPNRASDFSISCGDMLFDYSKTNIDADARAALIQMAQDAGLDDRL